MNNVEKELNKKRKELENIEIPDELESRLRQVLDSTPNKRKSLNYKSLIATAAIVILFVVYNVDAISYYGKKLIGYENVMNSTIKELDRLGKGQIIDKSYQFKDGSKITLDAIMLDTNNLVMFYTIYDPAGNVDEVYSDLGALNFKGLNSTYIGGGQGQTSDDGKEMKWIYNYNPPKFFEKNMKLVFKSANSGEEGEITFKLDRNQAMTESLKILIKKQVEIPDIKINVDSLVASPITTFVKGNLESIANRGVYKFNGKGIYLEPIVLDLLADGKKIDIQSSNSGTSFRRTSFDIAFGALPKDTKEIELKLNSFGATESVNNQVILSKEKMNQTINILNQAITINEVYEKDGNTYVNITTEESVYLTKLYLDIDGEDRDNTSLKIANERTIDEGYDEIVEKDGVEHLLRTRTVEFKGTGEKLKLNIQEIRYKKHYNQTIYKQIIK